MSDAVGDAIAQGLAEIMAKRHPGVAWQPVDYDGKPYGRIVVFPEVSETEEQT